MRIIDGKDWQPEGTVLAWLPTAEMTAARDAAPVDPTPASFLQADHVRAVLAQRARGVPHRAFTCSVATLPGVPDRDRLTAAVNAFVASHEGLRSSLTVEGDAPDGPIRRRTVDARDVDLTPVPVEGPLLDLVSTTAVFDHVPAMTVATVARDDGRAFDLFFALDHSAGDGISQMTGLLELMARYSGQDVPGLTADDHSGFPGYVREELERAATVDENSPGVRAWRGLFEVTGGKVPGFPLPIGIEDGEPQPVVGIGGEGVLAGAGTVGKLRELAREHGTGFSSVVYAALGLAQKRLTGATEYATIVVSATRGREYRFSQGWFCNFSPLYFPVRGDTVGEVLEDVKVAQARMKETLLEPVHASLGYLIMQGAVDPSVMTSPQMVTYLDLGWFEEPEGSDIRLFAGFGKTSNANLWVFRNPDGLGIGSQAPDNPVARGSLDTFFSVLGEVLSDSVAGA